ncbi:hypothetical protein [Thiobacillus sp.]|uniref:hypothetical protein n=1 Tax=Thiobacillus sp. TaxID=924 RepID=UPI0025EC5810|nr:hypothetical protein [Thiobacillus sp.]MBT9538472.1 hypothetical protein [Thiobacillus sp.]
MKRTHLTVLLFISWSVIAQSMVHAKTITNTNLKEDSREYAWFFSKKISATLFGVGRSWDQKLNKPKPCADEAVQRINLSILEPVDFPRSVEDPQSGAWYYQFDYLRCGETIRNNVVFTSQQGHISVVPYPPGNSLASPRLITDTYKIVAVKALLEVDGCKTIPGPEIVATRVTKQTVTSGTTSAPIQDWQELWTVRACGKDIDINVCFHSEHPKGTTTSIGPACRQP